MARTITSRHENRSDAIGDRLDRRFAALRLFDQADDLRQDGIAAHALRFDDQSSLLVDGATVDFGADGSYRLAGFRR